MHCVQILKYTLCATPDQDAISVIETDCEVDFAPPLDYVEPKRPDPATAAAAAAAASATAQRNADGAGAHTMYCQNILASALPESAARVVACCHLRLKPLAADTSSVQDVVFVELIEA